MVDTYNKLNVVLSRGQTLTNSNDVCLTLSRLEFLGAIPVASSIQMKKQKVKSLENQVEIKVFREIDSLWL
jgi:hypothetical protein